MGFDFLLVQPQAFIEKKKPRLRRKDWTSLAMGGLGRSEPHVVHQQKRRAAEWKAGHQHTENTEFHPNGSSPRGHSEPSCGRTRTPSCKSVFVPISAYWGNVGPGWISQAA